VGSHPRGAFNLTTDGTADPVLADYLNPDVIKGRTEGGALTMRDIYQHWVGSQPA
jgi:hypothetical protein